MTDPDSIARHYSSGSLLERLRRALEAGGRRPGALGVDDLAPADEFHIGGQAASADFLARLALTAQQHVLDIGCGIGGTSRFVADRYGCRVCGVDVTPEFVDTGRVLCEWTGLSGRVDLHHGSALALPFADNLFDTAIMLHVGMNIADKARLFTEVFRVLRPGATFGVYDVMQTGTGPIAYPVPWSATPATSALGTPEDYRAALEGAGFTVLGQRDRSGFALEFFAEARRRMEAAGGAPALGVHIAMGEDAPAKIANMVANIAAGHIAPVEIIARRG